MSAGRQTKCLIPKCNRPRSKRGQCGPCYQTSRRRVELGEVTWEQLIEAGWALEAHGGPSMSPATAAIRQLTETDSTNG